MTPHRVQQINSVPLHIVRNRLTNKFSAWSVQSMLDFAWLQGFYWNLTISTFSTKNDPPSVQQQITLLYTSLRNPHTKFSAWSSQVGLCLITRILSKFDNFPIFDQKWPPIRTTMNRVPVRIVRKPHTEFQLDRSSQVGLCLITRILSKFDNFPIFDQKWPPIGTKMNSVPVHIVKNPHTKFQLDRSSQAGLSLITS